MVQYRDTSCSGQTVEPATRLPITDNFTVTTIDAGPQLQLQLCVVLYAVVLYTILIAWGALGHLKMTNGMFYYRLKFKSFYLSSCKSVVYKKHGRSWPRSPIPPF
jgi:hypothetical protein